jgi:hypothetical protein
MQHSSSKLPDGSNKTNTVKDRLSSADKTNDHGTQSSSIGTFELYWESHLKEYERQADSQSKQEELSHCVEIVSQMVDLFKHNVIMPALQAEDNWHDDHRHQLKRNKGITGNSFLDHRAQKVAIEKGLTEEQWKGLLYLNVTAGDTVEMVNVSKDHLRKVHDMALRLLEGQEQEAVFALIDAIMKYIPKSHLTDR